MQSLTFKVHILVSEKLYKHITKTRKHFFSKCCKKELSRVREAKRERHLLNIMFKIMIVIIVITVNIFFVFSICCV